MDLEHVSEPLLPRRKFVGRIAMSLLLASCVVGVVLVLGMLGYHGIGGLPWIDSFENAAMILTGMGPVDRMATSGAKLFAGCYALLSGLVVLTVASIVLAPVLHRVMHRFHMETDEDAARPRRKS